MLTKYTPICKVNPITKKNAADQENSKLFEMTWTFSYIKPKMRKIHKNFILFAIAFF